MIMSLIRFLLFGLLIFAVDIYLRVASASLDSKLEKEDPLVAKKVERKGKLMFEPGLLTALDNENLLTNDHDELVNEINMLMFTMSLYLVLIAIWVRTFLSNEIFKTDFRLFKCTACAKSTIMSYMAPATTLHFTRASWPSVASGVAWPRWIHTCTSRISFIKLFKIHKTRHMASADRSLTICRLSLDAERFQCCFFR